MDFRIKIVKASYLVLLRLLQCHPLKISIQGKCTLCLPLKAPLYIRYWRWKIKSQTYWKYSGRPREHDFPVRSKESIFVQMWKYQKLQLNDVENSLEPSDFGFLCIRTYYVSNHYYYNGYKYIEWFF